MTKVEELEKAVLMLEEQVETNKTMSETYLKDLELAKKQLRDVNKPQLTASQLDDIQEAIEAGIEDFDFSDTGNFDIEYERDFISLGAKEVSGETLQSVLEKFNFGGKWEKAGINNIVYDLERNTAKLIKEKVSLNQNNKLGNRNTILLWRKGEKDISNSPSVSSGLITNRIKPYQVLKQGQEIKQLQSFITEDDKNDISANLVHSNQEFTSPPYYLLTRKPRILIFFINLVFVVYTLMIFVNYFNTSTAIYKTPLQNFLTNNPISNISINLIYNLCGILIIIHLFSK